MKSKDVKTILNLALRLTVIVAAVVLMLATVNAVTKDRISENNEKSRNEACGALIKARNSNHTTYLLSISITAI